MAGEDVVRVDVVGEEQLWYRKAGLPNVGDPQVPGNLMSVFYPLISLFIFLKILKNARVSKHVC